MFEGFYYGLICLENQGVHGIIFLMIKTRRTASSGEWLFHLYGLGEGGITFGEHRGERLGELCVRRRTERVRKEVNVCGMRRPKIFQRRWIRKAADGVLKPLDPQRVVVGLLGLIIMSGALLVLMHGDGGEEEVSKLRKVDDMLLAEGSQSNIDAKIGRAVDKAKRKTSSQEAVANGTPIAMLVGNYGYRQLAMNTICSLRRVGIKEHILLSLDEKMHHFAKEKNVRSILFKYDAKNPEDEMIPEEAAPFGSSNFVKVSLTKTAAVLSLIHRKVPVLFVDLDFSFVGNPVPTLMSHSEDVVATSDIIFDKDDPEKLNYRLNSGLFFVRPNPQVEEAFEEIARLGVRSGRSQQKAFNWVLCGQYGGESRGRGSLVGNDKCTWKGKKGVVSTKAVPLDAFPNGSGWSTDKAITIHHNFINGLEEKIQAIKDSGGWFYRENSTEMCSHQD